MIAPRDEIFTVLGEQVGENGEIVPIGFDIASNFCFWFYCDTNRPDLAGAKTDCHTPTGRSASWRRPASRRLPRHIRIWAMKRLDIRAEIVNVFGFEDLKEQPRAFRWVEGKPQ